MKKQSAEADKADLEMQREIEAVRKLIAEDPNYQPLLCKSVEDTKESRFRLTTNKDVRFSCSDNCRFSVTYVSSSGHTMESRQLTCRSTLSKDCLQTTMLKPETATLLKLRSELKKWQNQMG